MVSFSCNLPQGTLYSNESAPARDNYGGTILDGTNGVHVSCTVLTHAIHALITSPNLQLSVDTISAVTQAQMSFQVAGNASQIGSLNTVVSVDNNKNAADSCVLTVQPATSGDKYVLKPGSIFAYFNCPSVYDPQNPDRACGASGFFLFTGCDT